MKKLLAIVIILIAAYTAYWYVEATIFEKRLKEELAKAAPNAIITYDAIEKKGYPLSIQLVLVNPKLHMENDAIKLDMQGSLAADWSLFGTLKQVLMQGKSHVELPIGEEGALAKYSFEGDTQAEFDSLHDFGDKGVVRITNAKTNGPETNIHGAFEWSSDLVTIVYDTKSPNPDRAILNLDVELVGGKIKAEKSQELYAAFADSLAEQSGKTNASFVLACDLPSQKVLQKYQESPLLLLTEAFPPISVELKKLATVNAFEQDEVQAAVHISEGENKNIVLDVVTNGTFHYLPAYREAVLKAIDSAAGVAQNWQAQDEYVPLKNVLISQKERIKELVPHLETLGKLVTTGKLLAVVNKQTFDWHLSLDNFGVTCDKFGCLLSLTAQDRRNSTQADAHLVLNHVDAIVNEAVGFYNKAESIFNALELDPVKHLKPLPEGANAKLIAYLEDLSTTHDKDTLAIDISYRDGKTMIGHYTLEEARANLEAIWADMMPKPEPLPTLPEDYQ